MTAPKTQKPLVVSTPFFKAAVIINAVLCFLTLICLIVLAMSALDPMTKAQENLSGISEKVFMMTSGAFLGLLGGRAGTPLRSAKLTQNPMKRNYDTKGRFMAKPLAR